MPRGDWSRALLLICVWALGQGSQVHPDQTLAGELSSQIAEQYRAVSDFKASVLMSATLGQPDGKVKRYPGIRGYILFRKPAEMRIIGLDPMLGARAFDLVANGDHFRLSVPSKKRFVAGKGETSVSSASQLEKIPPRHLLEVILPKPVDPATETATVEEPGSSAGFILHLVHNARPSRTIWIDSAILHVAREVMFDNAGKTLSDARYSQWRQSDGVVFPMRIEVERPQEEYRLAIHIQDIRINQGLSDDMFVLEPPR